MKGMCGRPYTRRRPASGARRFTSRLEYLEPASWEGLASSSDKRSSVLVGQALYVLFDHHELVRHTNTNYSVFKYDLPTWVGIVYQLWICRCRVTPTVSSFRQPTVGWGPSI